MTPLTIGPYRLANNLLLAPMAGVTDRPFRALCRRLGAGLAVSEMVTSDPRLWNSRKSRHRLDHSGEPGPRSVQIAGGDPQMMAEAARLNTARGAEIIDINMGCPAKKVCRKAAGSALLRDEALVADILTAVVESVPRQVPVTLKIRTGWDHERRNGERVAAIAEGLGVAALTVHGRTRADAYSGPVEYDTIRAIKQAVSIPVIANGDIDSPQKAARVLEYTNADAIMVGRAAQGNPWIFREIGAFLESGHPPAPPSHEEVRETLLEHVRDLHAFYGDVMGVRIARKHIGWYLATQPWGPDTRKRINQAEDASEQLGLIEACFDHYRPGHLAA